MDDINPIKNPLSYEYQIPNYIWYVLLFLFFASLLFWYLYVHNKKQKAKVEKKEEKIFNPEKCKEEVNEKIKSLNKNNFKQYSFDLSLILKKYFSCYYQKNFIHYTTEELLRDDNISERKKNILQEIFSILDIIKFAEKQDQVLHFEKMEKLIKEIIT